MQIRIKSRSTSCYRIIQLGGTPVFNPSDWTKFARCSYESPVDPYVEIILNQNLKGERCAIQRYKEILLTLLMGKIIQHIKW